MPLAEDLYKNESNTIGENSYGFAHERLFFVTVFGGKNTLKRANIETKKKNIFLKCVHQHRSMSFFFFFIETVQQYTPYYNSMPFFT